MFGKVELREVKHFDDIEFRDLLNGRILKLLIDINANFGKGAVFHVLSKKHHIQCALKYLKIKEKDLARTKPSHIIAVQVIVENKEIKEAYLGGGSLETTYHKQAGENLHTLAQLEKAKKILHRVIALSEQLHEVRLIENIADHEYVIPS